MEVATIVVDSGAYSTRAGFGGESEPQCIIPTVVGRQKSVSNDKISSSSSKDIFVGSEVLDQSKNLNLKCPITDRVITNVEEMQALWSQVFTKEMNINTEEHPILITESPQNPKNMREKVTEIFMETFKVPAFYSTFPGILSLYANGNSSGLVIDAGESITQILPVFQCFGLSHITGRLDVGGRSLNNYLKKLLNDHDIFLPNTNEREIIRDIKEKMCYMALDFQGEIHKADIHEEEATTFPLPDGSTISIGNQRYFAPELFFRPSSFGISGDSLTQIIHSVLTKIDEDILPFVTSNVLLSGGSSMFPNFGTRIERELNEMLPSKTKISVVSPPNRKNSAWIGGSVLVSLATFSQMWITKEEYEEVGPEIIHLKCF